MIGNIKHTARQDRPISRMPQDALDRGPFVENLVRSLVEDKIDAAGKLQGRISTGYVLGLTGEWGLGKSSVLNLLHGKLSSMAYVTVATFNPWLFRGRDELIRAFFSELRSAMGESTSEQIRAARGSLDRYWAAIDIAAHGGAAVAEAHGFVGASSLWKKISGQTKKVIDPGELSPQQERKALEQKLKDSNCAIVVLIDELDRVDEDDVHAVAQLVKAVGDIKGISYLVAYDHDRVADALGRSSPNRREYGERYLEKIVAHAVPLRPLFDEDVKALLDVAVQNFNAGLKPPANPREEKIEKWLVSHIRTPREVKRLVGSFAVLERAVRGEISPYEILAYAWILTKSTSLRDTIAREFDQLVENPGEDEVMNRITGGMGKEDRKPSPNEILGDAAVPHEDLLKLLFPRFGDDRHEESGRDGMQISLRQNLVRLLYLGNPPGLVSVAQIRDIWLIRDGEEMEERLRALMAEGVLGQVIDRMDDMSGDLPTEVDGVLWPAISRIVRRNEPWATHATSERTIADQAATLLMRLGLRDRSQAPRVRKATAGLIAAGDLMLAPFILRKHLFIHGLTKHGPAGAGDLIFTRKETAALLEQEAPRYRAAVLDGIALRYLTHLEATYVLSNTHQWDDELRKSLTDQLRDPEALATYATLLVPPGYSTDHSHLEEMFDLDVIEPVAAAIDVTQLDPWVAASVQHLSRVMVGRDPHFPEDDEGEDKAA